MALEKKEKDAVIIDLVKYKIKKQLRSLPATSVERKMNESILRLYELGVISVTWSNDDMLISMIDGSDLSPELLDFPLDDNDEMEVVYQEKDDRRMEIEFIPDFDLDEEPFDELDDE